VSGALAATDADAIIEGAAFNEVGRAVAPAGDLNGDGINDLIIGAPRFPLNGADTGRAYVFFGSVSGSLIATQANAIIFGEAVNDGFGRSLAGAGDVNGDGVPDVIVGADQFFANAGAGKTYVFYGPLNGNIQAANAGAILTGEVDGDLFGAAVTGVGDFNGDGFSDVTVGARDNGAGGGRSGRAYTFFGPLTGTIPVANANSIVTGSSQDELGMSVAGGDFNGDGVPDLFAGAPQFATGAHGYAAIFFGAGMTQSDTSLTPTTRGPIVIPPMEAASVFGCS
jgi:hypothetical protein